MNINLSNPNLDFDLEDMTQAQLIGQIMYLLRKVEQLEEFQEGAFLIYPNIDLAIEYARRFNT
jgi:hypothetical protein